MIIRKISLGTDYRESMHYLNGQSVLQNNYTIHLIRQDDLGNVEIFIEKDNEVILWKKINHCVPFVIEYSIDF
jgi:hypothetical protein